MYTVSPAHGHGGSQDEVKLAYYALRPLPHPCAGWLAGRGEKFTTPSVYSSSLLVREIIILFGIYMSFSRFQYEILVHTPNTDVYRRILECRFTHFAPYVVHIETDVLVRTLPCPSTLARPFPTWWTCSNSFGLR